MADKVFELIQWCEHHGRTQDLILGATNRNPGNRTLQAVQQDLLGESPANSSHETPIDGGYAYDVFISYSSMDKEWVRGELLSRLEQAGLRVNIDFRDFELGVPSLVNIERAVMQSQHILLVLTPNWVSTEWTDIEALLVQTSDPAGLRRRIIPLLREQCNLPPRIAMLIYTDFTDPISAQWEPLVRRLQATGALTSSPGEPKPEDVPPNDGYADDGYAYDVFISYSSKDKDWVRNTLLSRLEQTELRVFIDFRDFELGVHSLVNMERAFTQSRRTLLILTPNWIESEWPDFETLLVQSTDPSGMLLRTIPLLRVPCELPPRIAMLTYADFTDPDDAQWDRLKRGIPGATKHNPGNPTLQAVQQDLPGEFSADSSHETPIDIQADSSSKITYSATQIKQLEDALLGAFTDSELKRMVRFELNEDLDEIAGGGNMSVRVFELIQWCEHHGRTQQLIMGASYINPDNASLLEVRRDLLDEFPPPPPHPSHETPTDDQSDSSQGITYSETQLKQLENALLGAFTDSELKMMVRLELNENLDQIVAAESTRELVLELVQWYKRRGRVQDLIHGAANYHPNNTSLRAIKRDLLGESPADSLHQAPIDDGYAYDVFISYSHKDKDWVRESLLSRLEQAGLRVIIDFRDFELGMPYLTNMEQALEGSRHTLLVLTSNWLDSEWPTVEVLMVQTDDLNGMRRRMIPLLREQCNLPPRIAMLTYADFTDPDDAQWDRLKRSLQAAGALTSSPGEPKSEDVSPDDGYAYDVFISYSSKDKDWVRNTLLSRLEQTELRVYIDFRDFELGVPNVVNMERAFTQSRRTLLILTPNWIESEWHDFEALLVQSTDPGGMRRRAIPLLRAPCELPARIKMLTYADFTDPDDAQWDRLKRSLQTT